MKLSRIGLIDGGLLLGFYASAAQVDIYLVFVLIRFERN